MVDGFDLWIDASNVTNEGSVQWGCMIFETRESFVDHFEWDYGLPKSKTSGQDRPHAKDILDWATREFARHGFNW